MSPKRILLSVAAGVAAFAAVGASASTLGGMTSASLGAEQTIVAACDDDGISLDYTTEYDAAVGGYKVTEVKIADVADACTGQDIKVTLGATDGVALSEVSGTVSGATQTLAVTDSVSAASVTTAAVTISG